MNIKYKNFSKFERYVSSDSRTSMFAMSGLELNVQLEAGLRLEQQCSACRYNYIVHVMRATRILSVCTVNSRRSRTSGASTSIRSSHLMTLETHKYKVGINTHIKSKRDYQSPYKNTFIFPSEKNGWLWRVN